MAGPCAGARRSHPGGLAENVAAGHECGQPDPRTAGADQHHRGTLYQKRYCPYFDLRTGSVIQFTAALAVTLPLAFTLETMRVEWSGEFVFALGWLVLVLSVGATTMLFRLIQRGAATRVTSLFYLTPAVTAVMAWLMFDETLGATAISGMVIAGRRRGVGQPRCAGTK